MNTNEKVAYGLTAIVVALILADAITHGKIKSEHYSILAGLVTVILGIRQKAQPKEPRRDKNMEKK